MIVPPPSNESVWFSRLSTLNERRQLLVELRMPYNLDSDNDKQLIEAIKKIDEQILLTLNLVNGND